MRFAGVDALAELVDFFEAEVVFLCDAAEWPREEAAEARPREPRVRTARDATARRRGSAT